MVDDWNDDDWDPYEDLTPEEREAELRHERAMQTWAIARSEARLRLIHQYQWSEAGANRFMDAYERSVRDQHLDFTAYWAGFWEKAEQTRW